MNNYVPAFGLSLAPSWAAKLLLGLSIVTGMAGFNCSSMIYILTRRKLWRFNRTMARFGGSMLALVSAGMTSMVSIVWLTSGFAVLVLGEFAERHLYFASVVYDRIPGTLK